MIEPKKAARRLISAAIDYMLPHTPGIKGEIPVYYYTDWSKHANSAMREIFAGEDEDGNDMEWYFDSVEDYIHEYYEEWLESKNT